MNLSNIAISRKTTAWVLTVLILLGGIQAFFNLGRLEDPEFTIKNAVVYTLYPGASPEEVEQEVTDRLEIAVQQLAQLKEVKSRSMRGLSIIEVEIKDKYQKKELPQVWDELRRKVGDAQSELPPGAGPSIVNDDFGDVYGIFFAVSGEGYTYAEIKDFVDMLRKELLLVKGVAKVAVHGDQTEAIYVEMSPRKMSQLGINPAMIHAALQSRNLVSDSGKVAVGDLYLPLDLSRNFVSVDQMGEMLISGGGSDNLIRLSDVATIKRGYNDPPQALLSYKGSAAIGIGVSIVPGGNVVDLGVAVKKRLDELKSKTPVGMKLNVITFQPDLVENSVNGFLINLFEAVLIVIAVLMLFMGLRSGLIIGAVLILTIAGTFMAMDWAGINLQRISLGALVLALGMLVDNAIVVAEGILVRVTQGVDGGEAASETVSQTAWPLLGATIVAILAFAALGLSNKQAGEFCYSLFQVMAISLLISWIFAVTITPLMCLQFLKVKNAGAENDPYRGQLFRIYRPILNFGLRFRWTTVLCMVLLFAISLYGFKYVDRSFFPAATTPSFLVDYWLPQGASIERTARDVAKLEKFVNSLDGVTGATAFVGQGGLRYALTVSPEFPNTAYGQLKVQVEDYKIIDGLLPVVSKYAHEEFPDALTIATKFQLGPGSSGKVRISFTGEDTNVLRRLSEQALAIMGQTPNAKDVHVDWRQRSRVLSPVVAQAQAEYNGIGPRDIAATINEFSSGRTVGVFRDRDKLLPIIVRSATTAPKSLDNLDHQQIWSPAAGRMIPLGQVVSSIDAQWEDGVIRRLDRKRTIEVLCDPVIGTAETLRLELVPEMAKIKLPTGYAMEWTGEYKDSREANESVFAGFPLAMLGMVIIVIVLFDALRQPLIIFLCLPLALIGVTTGLLVTGFPLSFTAVLGVLSLSGMLIKNAVVLIDQIDLEIKQGKPKLQGIKEASISRVRPVLMAAITTVLGMTPLIADAFYQSMAVTIISGLTFATLLTLVVVPVLYSLFFKAGKYCDA